MRAYTRKQNLETEAIETYTELIDGAGSKSDDTCATSRLGLQVDPSASYTSTRRHPRLTVQPERLWQEVVHSRRLALILALLRHVREALEAAEAAVEVVR